jgi:hypothetical protein
MFQKKSSSQQPSDGSTPENNDPRNNELPGSLGGFRRQNLRDFEGANKFDSSVLVQQTRLRMREEAGEVLQDHDYKIRVLLTCKSGVSVADLNAITGFGGKRISGEYLLRDT